MGHNGKEEEGNDNDDDNSGDSDANQKMREIAKNNVKLINSKPIRKCNTNINQRQIPLEYRKQ